MAIKQSMQSLTQGFRPYYHLGLRFLLRLLTIVALVLPLVLIPLFSLNPWTLAFCVIFSNRITRILGNAFGHAIYHPTKVTGRGAGEVAPKYTAKDVSVILPTVDPYNPCFKACLTSILGNKPAHLFVITVGQAKKDDCIAFLDQFRSGYPATQTHVSAVLSRPSKRHQIALAVPHITTSITVLADDHVFWATPNRFLRSILAPFCASPLIGAVAPKKVVRRPEEYRGSYSWRSIINYLACNYLERHNWELRASNALDGGVFVISGRTAAYRTDFLQEDNLMDKFVSEKFFFGMLGRNGGLGPDDNNFLTRELLKKGWKIKFQDTDDATIETTLGEWPTFRGQLVRWARTTVRSNPVMLRDVRFCWRHTWSYFMVYLPALYNFALLWDAMLLLTLVKSCETSPGSAAGKITTFVLLMLFSKTVKVMGHIDRHFEDLRLLPVQIVFGWVHSFVKLWALLTFWNGDWSGRDLDEKSCSKPGDAEDGGLATETMHKIG